MKTALRILQIWGVPVGMSIAYAVLMWSSETDNTGKAWMAIGLGFVFVVWIVFRMLTETAAMSRAVAIGDATRVLELTEQVLRKKKGEAARAPALIQRASAYELRGDWAAALASVDEAKLSALSPGGRATWQLQAAAVRVAALTETGKVAEARRVLDAELVPVADTLDRRTASYLVASLATGRVLYAEGALDAAMPPVQKVIDDIRSGAAMRGTAYFYAARIAEAKGDPGAAVRHRDAIAKLVPADAWIRTSR
jgi:hypothetical protein